MTTSLREKLRSAINALVIDVVKETGRMIGRGHREDDSDDISELLTSRVEVDRLLSLIPDEVWLVEHDYYDNQYIISAHLTRDEALAEGRRYAVKHESERYPNADPATRLAIIRSDWDRYRVGRITLGPHTDFVDWEGLGDPPTELT